MLFNTPIFFLFFATFFVLYSFSYYDGIDVFTKMLAEGYSGVLGYDEGGA